MNFKRIKSICIFLITLVLLGGLITQISMWNNSTWINISQSQDNGDPSFNSLAAPDLITQWTVNTSSFGNFDKLWGISVGDGEGDKFLEIAVVGENGVLYCLDGLNGSYLWEYNCSGPTYSVDFGDIGADEKDEIVTTRIIDPGFPKIQNVTVFNFITQLPISGGYSYSSLPATKVLGVGMGDINNNSKEEVLFLDNQGILYVFDGESNAELDRDFILGAISPTVGNQGFDINFGDINGDNLLEFVVSGVDSVSGNGSISLNHWNSGAVQEIGAFILNSSAYCSTADFGDIDGDGKDEIVVGSRQNLLDSGGEIFLLNGETLEIIWQFNTSSNNVYDISCGDVLGDGRDEIAISVGGTLNYTYIVEGENNSIIWGVPSNYEINGIDLADVNNDGKCELITIGNEFVNLYCIDTDGDGLTDIDDLDDDNDTITDILEATWYGTNQFLVDSDLDNLTDPAELFTYSTNPVAWDSDNDNLSDWMEIFYYFTNATNPNSDGDYLTDGEEILLGLIPTDPDTYNDGFFDSWSYFLDTDNDNLTNFQELNIYFTLIDDIDTDNDGLSDWMEIFYYFTNATNPNSDGDYLTDGEEILLGLIPTDPDTYNDGFFDSWSYFLDTDNDNLTNFQELNIYFTLIDDIDTDNDGLSDWQEVNITGTCPTNPNSDGDFLTDYEEIQQGLDPLDPDTNNDGILDGGVAPETYDWLFYLLLGITIALAVILTLNVKIYLKYRTGQLFFPKTKKKAEILRKRIKEAVWFWGHGSKVLQNFDNLVAKNTNIITLEALTRTWTQHYKNTFKKIFKLTEEEASERAEKQKKKEILELYELLKDKIDVKKVPITFGKYAGTDSYQFEIWDEGSDTEEDSNENNID